MTSSWGLHSHGVSSEQVELRKKIQQAIVQSDLVEFKKQLPSIVVPEGDEEWARSTLSGLLNAKTPLIRVSMFEALIQAGHLPKPDPEWDAMRRAMSQGAFECLPLLHQCGWTLQTVESKGELGQYLGMGHWPHPDLIKPQLFNESLRAIQLFQDHLFVNLMADTNVRTDWMAHIEKIQALPSATALKGELDQGLAQLSWADEWPEEKIEKITPVIKRLLDLGWLNAQRVAILCENELQEVPLNRWLASIFNEALETGTPAAPKRSGSAPRL